ncbi:hypothetical protein MAR_004344, partial [Mya arenaria]
MDIINDKSNDKGQSSNSGITNSQYQLPQTPQAQYCSPGYMYPQNMNMAASPYPVWGSLTPGVTNSGQATPNSPGSVNNDLVTMLIKRLDSMDSKLARLDSIQSSVNTINTRIQSMDTKINDLESKVRDIERIPVRDVLSVTSDATYIVGPSLNDSREQLFDVTRDGPVDTTVIHERSIGEPMLSCNVVDEAEVEYEVVEEGSNRKRQKLVSSDGFSYCVKDIAGEYSICIIEKLRNKERPIPVGSGDAASDEKTCLAMRRLISGVRFYQRGEVFSRGAKEHCHPADPLIKKRVLLTRDVRQKALRDVHAPAGSIVEGNMVGVFKDGEFNIPRPSNLLRRVNRSRQKVRPKDPTSLDFEVDTDYPQDVYKFVCKPCNVTRDGLVPIDVIPVRDVLSVTSDATYIVGPSLNDSREQLFDVTRDGPVDTTVIHERSIGEPMLSCNVVDEAEVEYEVVEEGSNRKRQKLVSSDGFSYCVKDIAGEYSICIIEKLRNKERPIPVGSGDAASDEKTCLAMRRLISGVRFYQRGEVFSRGAKEHCHPADPLIKKRVLLTRDVRQKALRDVHAPAGSIVEGNMVGVFKDGEFNIPRPSNLLRRVNRSRQKVRPKDPTSLDFEVDTDYLQESFFIGDVRVGDERHLMFSTPSQLQFLGQARRWYLDGTFRVVNRPFTQLWSVHAFLQQGESVKQVPLLYVLMSKRRKQDYVAVLQKLIEIMEEAPKVEGFVMDFEA